MPAIEPHPSHVKAAVIGLGRMGLRHAINIAKEPQATLVAAATISKEEKVKAEHMFPGVRIYLDAAEMLEKERGNINTLFVASATMEHVPHSRMGLDAGLHVFCEKPLSVSVEETEKFVEYAKSFPDQKVMVGFSRRFDASYRTALRKLQAGEIGRPELFRSWTCDLFDPNGFFIAYSALSGGIFVDCAIHDIDLTLQYFGEDIKPVRAFASGTANMHPELLEFGDADNAMGLVEFSDGRIASYWASRTMAHGHDVASEIIGTKGKLMINIVPRSDRVETADVYGVRSDSTPTYWERFQDAFTTECSEFCEAIVKNKPVPLALKNSITAGHIAAALQRSYREHRVVTFDKDGREIVPSESKM